MGGLHLKNPKVPQGFQQRPFSRKGEGGVWLVADFFVSLYPGSGRSPGEGNGNPLQYLENSMDGGAW